MNSSTAYPDDVILVPAGFPFWQENLFLAANIVLIGVLYAWGVLRARRTVGWNPAATLSFFIGLGTLLFAATGPPMAWAHVFFWPHMVQHLLIMMIAVPLMVLGNPITLAVRASSPTIRRSLVRMLRSRPVRILTNPVLTWLLFAGTLLITHIPVVMEWSLESHHAMHLFIFPLYTVVAFLFYVPLIGHNMLPDRPKPSIRVISLGLMMVPETLLGMIIHFSPVVLYPSYALSASTLGADPLLDQKFAGALAWALTMVIDGLWTMLAAWEWFRDQERNVEREESVNA